MRLLVIGAGNMGLTYSEGMAKSSLLNRHKLMIYDKSPELVVSLSKIEHFDVYDNIEECLPEADVVFLAVKPYHVDELFEEIKPLVNNDQIFVSIMAGVTIEKIQAGLGVKKVVRAMPNLPAQVGKGVTSYTEAKEVSRVELLMIRNLLDTTGESIKVENENYIDASTGISGSGPAYVFYFMQSMLEAALKMGFSKNDSKVLVSQTFEGAVELFNQSDLSPETWMERVASKGGTTRAALDSMEDNNVKELIKDAAYAAFDRAVELGKQ
ncbi:pyrroline-5-carboxylate reductase [Antarcticibacterium flavum]|uniref:Pyrroline-5-carboxylate reductase n=1 Tax=Antarcticibacterium flavum TaxID=2058175 RepID=A0A5B7X1L2_9FLAO|nr:MULTISPECIES: pyrroline-5-carboxylate reductase [Antarcticibacterium]MCM4158730.1 pyrroline-5-carboxylate reductase [Antarcticibacterium sp. W02-3]QCY68582.1 pyrroline-5-carboxylate reductase [Antarcticibacterium flavum]